MTLEGTSIPEEMPTEEIIEEIVSQLELPRTLHGRKIEYSLLIVNKNYSLTNGESLFSAGVNDGDIIRIVSSDKIEIDATPSLDSANISTSKPLQSAQTLRIFLCHSSGDKQAVHDLYKRLRSDGFDPWLDEENLLPGQDWNHEIISAVRNSDVVLVCLSEKAIGKAGYVQKEIKYALDVADEQPEGAMFLIPVKLEECNVPQRLSRWQWVNFFEHQGYRRLFMALEVKATQVSLHVGQGRKPDLKLKTGSHPRERELEGFHPLEQPFPYKRIVHWIPKEGGGGGSLTEGNAPAVNLIVTQEVLLKVSEHVSESLKTELGGFLLGNQYRCQATNLDYIIIDQVSEATIVETTEFNFGPTRGSWARLADELSGKYKGKLLLGWYHSHPGLGVFLSQNDIALHQERFNKPWMTALVIEPEKHLGGFFCWRNGRVNPDTPVAFYELVEHSTRDTVVAWSNYTGVDVSTSSKPSLASLNTNSSRGRSLAKSAKRILKKKPDDLERSTSTKLILLDKVYNDLIKLAKRSKFIEVQPLDVQPYQPPDKYTVTFTCLGIAGINEKGEPQFSEFHQVSIYLPDDFSNQGPILRWITPIWHPNIEHVKPHHVDNLDWCSHMSLNAGYRFDWLSHISMNLVILLGEMVQYKRYHAEWTPPYPLDHEVARWVLEYAEPKGILNKDKPLDERLLVQP
jgi:proteasome lid subunit RPN8/RPN11